MPNLERCLLLFLAPAFAVSTAQPQSVDADNVDQALGIAAVEIQVVEKTRIACDQQVPGTKLVVDHYAFVWRDSNDAEIDAVDSHVSSAPDPSFLSSRDAGVKKAMAAQEADIARNADGFCSRFVDQIKSGERNIAQRTPRASRFLKADLLAHPFPQAVYEGRQERIGCMKEGLNKRADYDKMLAFCSCTFDVIESGMSRAEYAEFLDVAGKHGDPRALPQFLRIAPRLAECAKAMK